MSDACRAQAGTVLIVSASMGAGHDGAARELARRLEARGHAVEIVDFLAMLPGRLGPLMQWAYMLQLRRLGWTYDLTFSLSKATARGARAIGTFCSSRCSRRRLHAAITRHQPSVIVSTYPLASLTLGWMRRTRRLSTPVVTYLTDFGVHPLWVHPAVDLHLAVSEASGRTAARLGACEVRVLGPVVAPRFAPGTRPATSPRRSADRAAVRTRFQIPIGARVALVVAGSWGVGHLERTVGALLDDGRFHPVVVCGRNDALRAGLAAHRRSDQMTLVGWTDEMPALMQAADALVENAGGLTVMEAFASGLPVLTHRPLPGHGKDNARTMAGAGVTVHADDASELLDGLEQLTSGGLAARRHVETGRRLFVGDPAAEIAALATRPERVVVPIRPRRRFRVAAAAVAGLGLLYGGVTAGAEAATAAGVDTAKAPARYHHDVFLGIAVRRRQLSNPATVAQLEAIGASVVVDGRTADSARSLIRPMAASGLDIANGGSGRHRTFPWSQASDDCHRAADAIADSSGHPPRELVLAGDVNAFHHVYCRSHALRQHLVHAQTTLRPGRLPDELAARRIYLLDVRKHSPAATNLVLRRVARTADQSHVTIRPLSLLR